MCLLVETLDFADHRLVCVSSLLIAEIKRIIKDSEIMKYRNLCSSPSFLLIIQGGRLQVA